MLRAQLSNPEVTKCVNCLSRFDKQVEEELKKPSNFRVLPDKPNCFYPKGCDVEELATNEEYQRTVDDFILLENAKPLAVQQIIIERSPLLGNPDIYGALLAVYTKAKNDIMKKQRDTNKAKSTAKKPLRKK